MKITQRIAALLLCLAIYAPAARAERYGLADSHHVWHDSQYWHERHPDWVYRYHPEWAVERQEWWELDHEQHPDWFMSPFWEQYPVWTYGDYDDNHVWHYAGWWHERNPAWFYAHHPGWAEVYPGWMRRDHEGHPEWFRSAYWQEHRHDWNHPDEAYRHTLERSNDYQKEHAREQRPQESGGREVRAGLAANPNREAAGIGAHPQGQGMTASNSGFHQAPTQPTFHAPAPSAPNISHAASGSTSKHH